MLPRHRHAQKISFVLRLNIRPRLIVLQSRITDIVSAEVFPVDFDRWAFRVGHRCGGVLKHRLEDFEVREVRLDGKVAEFDGVRSDNLFRDGIHCDVATATEREPSFNQELTSAFEEGQHNSDEILEREGIGLPDDRTLNRMFEKAERGPKSFVTERVTVLENDKKKTTMADTNEFLRRMSRVRGALFRAYEPELIRAPAKLVSGNAVKVYIAVDLPLQKALRKFFTDPVGILSFIEAGYSADTFQVKLLPNSCSRGHSAKEAMEAARRALCRQVQNLQLEDSGRLSWSVKESTLALFNDKVWHFELWKKGLDGPRLCSGLERRLQLPPGRIKLGGTKDKRAVTSQFASLPTAGGRITPSLIRESLDAMRLPCEVANFEGPFAVASDKQ